MGNLPTIFRYEVTFVIAEFMEDGLDVELSEELGYSKYDYKNKDTDNSRITDLKAVYAAVDENAALDARYSDHL